MRATIVVVAAMLTSAMAWAHPEGGDDALHFKQHGFSIKPLKAKSSDNVMTQVVTLQMSATDGFASNVNVQLQPFGDSLEDYIKLSKQQFDQVGFKVLTQKKVDAETYVLEYTGKMQGMELHWYARATKKKGKPVVYLVTGTSTMAQWTATSAALKDCVDSLRLE